MRHGATIWGGENRFAGWGDTPMSATGVAEVRDGARVLCKTGLTFDLCVTSRLRRATDSLGIVGEVMPLGSARLLSDWRLNERHYGALQGETRAAMIERYGNEQVVAWRRSYDARPPLLGDEDPRWLEQIARFPDIPLDSHPRGESLADAVERITPVWTDSIAGALRAGGNVLLVAHTSSMRAIVRAVEGLDDAASAAQRFATAVPRAYAFDEDLRVVSRADITGGLRLRLRHWSARLKPRRLGWI